ncbi:unnamed protein product [Lactuca saligna]|uniref:CTP synthase (glutamine hydrolyzing) n=1 Tax=Lactuca saligna TaxID=75948 RepID=A0AA35YEL9_LACSI|nr:unnamed protein product [Lactuca saligna]
MFVNTTKPKTAVPSFACSPICSSAATLLPYFHAAHRPMVCSLSQACTRGAFCIHKEAIDVLVGKFTKPLSKRNNVQISQKRNHDTHIRVLKMNFSLRAAFVSVMLLGFVLLVCSLEQRARLRASSDMNELLSLISTQSRLVISPSETDASTGSILSSDYSFGLCCMLLLLAEGNYSSIEEATTIENPDVHRAAWNSLKSVDGVLVPGGGGGGVGDRGVEGKIIAAKYARENNITYLSICLGMQIVVIEYARSVLGLENANSTEFDPNTKNPCVIFIPKGSKTHMGGTIRLGSRRTYFQVMYSKASQLPKLNVLYECFLGLGYKIDEIVQAWNEMYEVKRWQTGVPSFRLEPLFRRNHYCWKLFLLLRESNSDFSAQLVGFMATLLVGAPDQAHKILELAKFDFNIVVGHLVASVPEIYSPKHPYISDPLHYLTVLLMCIVSSKVSWGVVKVGNKFL